MPARPSEKRGRAAGFLQETLSSSSGNQIALFRGKGFLRNDSPFSAAFLINLVELLHFT